MSSRVIVGVVALRPRLVRRVADVRVVPVRVVTADRDVAAAARVVRVGVVVVRAVTALVGVTVRVDTPREEFVTVRSRIGEVVRDVTVGVVARRDEVAVRSRGLVGVFDVPDVV